MSTHEEIEPLEKLLRAAGGSVHGKKKLHKLAFLCQASGTDLGLEFTFHYYGVYSPTLSNLMREARTLELIEFDDSISNGPVPITLLESNETSVNSEERGLNLVEQLKDVSARALEVLSTIVYLERLGYRNEDLRIKLTELKGHLQPYYTEGFSLAQQHFGIE